MLPRCVFVTVPLLTEGEVHLLRHTEFGRKCLGSSLGDSVLKRRSATREWPYIPSTSKLQPCRQDGSAPCHSSSYVLYRTGETVMQGSALSDLRDCVTTAVRRAPVLHQSACRGCPAKVKFRPSTARHGRQGGALYCGAPLSAAEINSSFSRAALL